MTVDVTGLSPEGYGVDASGKLRVTGALPGERVIARPFTRRQKKLYLRTESVELASPDRVPAICSAAAICGGCSLQHVNGDRQLADKSNGLAQALGTVTPKSWLPPLRGPVSGYRSKARVGVKFVARKERVLVGFREKMSPYVAEIDYCEVLVPALARLLPPLAETISLLDARASIPQLEVAAGDDGAALVFRHLAPLCDSDIEVLRQFATLHSVSVFLQPGGPSSVTLLQGSELLRYQLPAYELSYDFHPMEFTQVNQAINRQLVDLALDLLDPLQEDVVLDLFCGIGNFTLPIARCAGHVLGMELSESSIDRARKNAMANGITNVDFSVLNLIEPAVDVGTLVPANATKVLLDPPRSGAEAICEALASTNVHRVVYVSCNPLTLARDVKILVDHGFQLEQAGVIDMFPHTTHVESIASLKRS